MEQIKIILQGGEAAGELRHYRPGEEIAGTVQIVSQSMLTCNHVYVRLYWHTQGRGDLDDGKISEVDVFQGPIAADMPVAFDFRFTLPAEPWSFAGYYVTIVWEIAVEIDVSWSINPKQSQMFILAPFEVEQT